MSETGEVLPNFDAADPNWATKEYARKIFDAKIVTKDEDVDLEGIDVINGVIPESLESLMTKQFSDDIWLVDGLIPVDGITIISALPGSFKTWILLDMAQSVASGTDLFGKLETKQGGVLIIDEENGERLLQQRLKKLGVDHELPIYFLSDADFRLNEDTVFEVIEYCDLYDIKLVTFDSLVRIHDANENDAKEMASVFRAMREITKRGITVVIAHHNRKPSGNSSNPSHEMRGSSDILAALDCHLALARIDHKSLLLTQTKVRLAEELPALELQVVSDEEKLELVYMGSLEPREDKREIARTVILAVLDAHEPGLNQRQLLDTLKRMHTAINARTLRSILEKMQEEGIIIKGQGQRNAYIYKLVQPSQEDE
jgi:predicted transcriptional regulator